MPRLSMVKVKMRFYSRRMVLALHLETPSDALAFVIFQRSKTGYRWLQATSRTEDTECVGLLARLIS